MVLKKKLQSRAKLLYNKEIKAGFWRLALNLPRASKAASAGQFLNLKVADGCQPLLRRPFSIHRAKGSKIEILYERLGPGTQILSQKKPGEYLDVIGPLGNGFNFSAGGRKPAAQILVAGGMGVAPLIFLAEKLTEIQNLVLIGAKTKGNILCEKEFKKLGCEVKIATDDGSRGFKGRVTVLLERLLSAPRFQSPAIYACGPKPMLKEVCRISQENNIPAQVSLEEHLACGIGACLGCVVNTKEGHKRVCREGPVFNAEEIIW